MTRPAGFDDDVPRDTPASSHVIRGELADGSSPRSSSARSGAPQCPHSARRDSGAESTAQNEPRYVKSEPFHARAGYPGGPGVSTLGPPDASQLPLKSPLLAAALGFALGPLGLLYSNLPWAFGLGIFAAILIGANLWVVLPAVWLICAFIGFSAAARHNARLLMRSVSCPAGQAFPHPPHSGTSPQR